MTAPEIADRLQATKTPSGWSAKCPAHDDRNASLTINEGNDGRVLVNCHAGCEFSAIVAAMDLKPADLFPPRASAASNQQRRIVAAYDYTDGAGKLLFQVCRYAPKDFRQRRPDPEHPGAWTWNLKGVERVLYRLPDVLRTVAEGRAVFIVEGERDADALAALGLCATCNSGGAGKWQVGYSTALKGAAVVILPDRDEPGRRHGELVARALRGNVASLKVVELPDRDGRRVKDAADWIGAGGTVEELREIVEAAPEWQPAPDAVAPEPTAGPGKPAVLLPGGAQSISDTGRALGELLAATERYFVRGGAVVKLAADPDGLPRLEDVKPASLASDFETVADLRKAADGGNLSPATCPEQTAKMIAAAASFRDTMQPLRVLTRCPVLIERAGSLVQIVGYDRESGILAAGQPAEPMDVAAACCLLSEILDGFRFATPADRARALAAMITPALVFGGLLRGRAPVDLGEADASQTGKGYRNKLTAALYAQTVKTVTQQRAGVGSMEESFNMALIRGANFIALDNVRGRIDSPGFESFLTEDAYLARAPFREPVEIDPRRVCVMLTSNKADVTTDLANRCACVRLLKQPDGHAFAPYPEGDILEHVRAMQPRYLGAVFALVRAWHEAGKPRTTETRHDFRPWAQTLDWITQNLLDAGPLLEGHRETQARMTNPVMNWLRDVAIEVLRARQAGAWLRAGDIVALLAETGIETPGLPEHGDLADADTRKAAQQATGRKLSLCFRAGDVATLDNMTVERREGYDPGSRYTCREYCFSSAAMETTPIAANPAAAGNSPPQKTEPEPELDLCGYGRGYSAANETANKTLAAANAANTTLIGKTFETMIDGKSTNIVSIGTISRIAATTAPEPAAIETGEI